MSITHANEAPKAPDRIQTGLRMDRRLLKVLKGLAEYKDMSLADLVEGILLHALDGNPALTDGDTLAAADQLRHVYGLELSSVDAHRFPER